MEQNEATQLTQGITDPRRIGRNNSGLSANDVSDVMCILHPCSPAAFRVVASTAERASCHVLQRDALNLDRGNHTQSFLEEQETFILGADGPSHAMDLAFRFSTLPISPKMGFVFGRHEAHCDIVLSGDAHKRVSNLHFRIFMNESGVLMLHDMSTNGTMVDDVLLRGKKNTVMPQTRMLNPGSIIQILSPQQEEIVKFIVRVPLRDGHYDEYLAKFHDYMERVNQATLHHGADDAIARRITPAVTPKPLVTQSIKAPLLHKQFGMHWSGGDKYNVVGLIGKGAFATVYQLATKAEGMLFAAKELEKRKFMKNGVLDHKLDNEMQIMKDISHPHIVQYIDYQDHANHLYIIMELVPCGDLQHFLNKKGPLSETLGKRMSAQVLDSLVYLHGRRITHRDIKPDNILLADISPENFTIKLSDFGLSKVVTDNDTFLKTFCGTLLYCAPEVFPHYDAHVAGRGQKRPRRSAAHATKFHSYSQSVDIWSYGAVLWYSLCLRPPFEGVADATGRGMFDKIMLTPLDSTHLVKEGISKEAISLLVDMLNTDPGQRPSPVQCLHHDWFRGEVAITSSVAELNLRPIAEEAEGVAEQSFAGLAISGQNCDVQYDDEVSVHSDSFQFFDPRQSKRIKASVHDYRSQELLIDSSPEIAQQAGHDDPSIAPVSGHAAGNMTGKLFGEISESQFAMLNLPASDTKDVAISEEAVDSGQESNEFDVAEPVGNGAIASPSLLGTESLLRDIHMGSSPETSGVTRRVANVQGTPPLQKSTSNASNAPQSEEVTPKQPQPRVFNRQMNIPLRAGWFYDPNNPATHNEEYASRVSGHDFKADPNMLAPRDFVSLPQTATGSVTEDEQETSHVSAVETPLISNEHKDENDDFVKPAPRLGRLVSTEDSFAPITINVAGKITSWGRAPNCTYVYPDPNDTRIPKRGIIIYFYGPGLQNISDSADLSKIAEIHATILTESRGGLKINGVSLPCSVSDTRYFGTLHTGDEIVVVQPGARGTFKGLKFRCEFYHGESKAPRSPSAKRFDVQTVKDPLVLTRDVAKVKGDENDSTVANDAIKCQ